MHGYQNPQRSVTPSWCEASKTSNPESNNPCKCILNIHLQHIKNTYRHSFNTEILAGKTASICINKNASLQRCSEHKLQQSLGSFSTLSAYYFYALSSTFLPHTTSMPSLLRFYQLSLHTTSMPSLLLFYQLSLFKRDSKILFT
jgi:hypothetical protein